MTTVSAFTRGNVLVPKWKFASRKVNFPACVTSYGRHACSVNAQGTFGPGPALAPSSLVSESMLAGAAWLAWPADQGVVVVLEYRGNRGEPIGTISLSRDICDALK